MLSLISLLAARFLALSTFPAAASPTQQIPLTNVAACPSSPWQPPEGLNISYVSPLNSTLPNVMVLAFGGTIAGAGQSRTDSGVYNSSVLGVKDIVQAIPEIFSITNVYGADMYKCSSYNETTLLSLLKYGHEVLCGPTSIFDGLVVTHGTVALEEVAFFLDLTINCEKPVVISGSMRPTTALSPDGDANLFQALSLAAHPAARSRGAMIALNDRIGSVFYTLKTHANYVDTYKAPDAGYLGGFSIIARSSTILRLSHYSMTDKNYFNLSGVESLPPVEIIHGHLMIDPVFIEYLTNMKGVKGFVASDTKPEVRAFKALKAIAAKFPVVDASRFMAGMSPPNSIAAASPIIASGLLTPQKSRILLQLALATGQDPRTVFEDKLRSVLWGA